MRTGRLVDFWAAVLWLNGPWAWLSQELEVAGERGDAGSGGGLWGGNVTRGKGIWACTGVERRALLPGN